MGKNGIQSAALGNPVVQELRKRSTQSAALGNPVVQELRGEAAQRRARTATQAYGMNRGETPGASLPSATPATTENTGGFSHSGGKIDAPTTGERLKRMASGAGKQYVSGYTNLAGLGQAGAAKRMGAEAQEEIGNLERGIANQRALLNDPSASAADRESARTMIESMERKTDAYRRAYGVGGENERTAAKLYGTADALAESGARDVQEAKRGLGKAGSLAVDVGVGGMQLGADILLGLPTGGAMLPMALRSAGGSAQEARQEGATHKQQTTYGMAAGAISVLTEGLSNAAKPLAKVFGKGIADDAVEQAVKSLALRLAKTPAGRTAAQALLKTGVSALGEGFEEMAEDAFDVLAKKMIYDPTAQLDVGEMLYDGLVGGVLGGVLGAGGEIAGARGEYEKYRIKKVGQSVKSDTSLLTKSVPQNGENVNAQDMQRGAEYAGDPYDITPELTDEKGRTWEQIQAERAAENAAPAAGKGGIVYDDYVTREMDSRVAGEIDAVAKSLGVRVRMVDEVLGGAANGKINGSDILIAKDAVDPVMQVVGHEWTHRVQQLAPEQYRVFRDALVSDPDIAEAAKILHDMYNRRGVTIDMEQALDEAAANYAGEMIANTDVLDDFIRRHGNDRTMLQKLRDAIHEIVGKLTGRAKRQAQTVEGKLQAAFEAAAKSNEKAATEGGETRYSFSGERAKSANLDNLQKAKQMQESGADMETIRKSTGWHFGRDGKWRFEIDDSMVKLKHAEAVNENIPNYTTLGELIDAPELFAAYPDMANVSVTFQTLEDGQNGGYSRKFDSIDLSRSLKNRPVALLNSVIHEVQHAIQNREGFAAGASPAYWNRRLENGFDGRTAESKRKGAQLQARYKQMRENDPQFVAAMEELNAMTPTLPRGKIDFGTLEQIEPDPPEWVRYDERRDHLEEQYGDRVWDWYSLWDEIDRNARSGDRLSTDLYHDTAGEIEARDTAKRRELTAEERREKAPDYGNEDTVFSENGNGYSMSQNEQDSVKKQLRDHQDELSNMKAVATVRDNGWKGMSTGAFRQKIVNDLKKTGYRVDNPQFGIIEFDEKLLNRSLNYIQTDAEAAAYQAIPQVLKRGIEISGHGDHKGRGYDTITIAAPVELNGKRGNMAIVVMKTKGNRYKVHRILTTEGEAFVLPDMANAEPNTVGAFTNDSQSLGGSTPAISSASDISIRNSAENVNAKFTLKTDSEGRELTEAQQKFFKDSQVRDEDGNLLVVYHGTDADFTVFDRTKGRANMDIQGSFFSPWDIDAEGYGGNVKAYYLNITNPASENIAYRALNRFKGQNGAGIKAREYLQSLGYDGVNNSGEEYIAFYPEQIKLVGNKTPTNDPDIRFSLKGTENAEELAAQQKAAPAEGAARSNYNALEADAIRREGKTFRNLVAGIDTSVSDFFDKWRGGRKSGQGEKLEKLYLGKLTEAQRKTVSDILGYPVSERNVIVTNDDVKHIIREHGSAEAEIRKGNLPLERWAIDALPEVVANPDSITPGEVQIGGKNDGKRGVLLSKNMPNGKVVTVQFDNKGRETIEITTMYVKENSGDFTQTLNVEKVSPQLTAEPESGPVSPAIESSISNHGENVNAQDMQRGAEYAGDPYDITPELTDEKGRTWEQIQAERAAGSNYNKKGTPTSTVNAANAANTYTSETFEPEVPNGSVAPKSASVNAQDMQGSVEYAPDGPGYLKTAKEMLDDLRRRAPQGPPKPETVRGTGAMDTLGIRIEGDQGDYALSVSLRGMEQARRKTTRERRKAEERLYPTAAEKAFAKGLADGIYQDSDIPASMNRERVRELADYYYAESSFKGAGGVQERAAEIREQNEQLAKEIFSKAEAAYRPMNMLKMNLNTPERVMRQSFGAEIGEKISDAYFYPTQKNEAEKVRWIGRMLDEVRTFKDKNGIESELTLAERAFVQQIIEDRAVGETLASMELRRSIEKAAENIRNGKDAKDAAKEFGLDRRERELAEKLARWKANEELLASGEWDSVKIENAVEKFSKQYDLFYDAINDFLTAHGFQPIGFIKGYAPHMQKAETQGRLSSALKAMGVNIDVTELPTSISGRTADYKPGKRWVGNFLHRKGDKTDYDISAGYESYVGKIADVFYHTDDIARLRGLERYLRKTYAPEEISSAIDHAQSLRNVDSDTKRAALEDAGIVDGGTTLSVEKMSEALEGYIGSLYDDISKVTKYGEFVKYIGNYANLLAGKQSMADRGLEYIAGRTSLNAGNKLVSAFARAQVAGNLSSVLNQSSQLKDIMAEIPARHIAKAVGDICRSTGGKPWNVKNTEMFNSYDLLTGKKGVEYLTAKDSRADAIVTALFKPADIADSLVSALAVQSRYNQLIGEGKAEADARAGADRWATSIMASRMKGSRPMIFESKNVVTQMISMFQVEAANSWAHLTQDLPANVKSIEAQYGKGAAQKYVAVTATKGLLSAFLLNRIAEAAYGGTPASFDLLGYAARFISSGLGITVNEGLKRIFKDMAEAVFGRNIFGGDDDDEEEREFDWSAAASDAVYDVSNDIPFVRGVSGALGLGDQTLPLANVAEAVGGVKNAITAEDKSAGQFADAVLELGSTLAPGGRQLQKTYQGAKTMLQGGRTYGYGDKKRLQYTVEQTPLKAFQALAFGNSGLSETRDFYAGDAKGLSVKQTQAVEELHGVGVDRAEAYDIIQKLRGAEKQTDKVRIVAESDLTDRQKLEFYTKLIASTDSKKPEQFRGLMARGLDWQDITEAYELYTRLQEEGEKATWKATRFASWADEQGFTKAQKERLEDTFAFYSQSRAEADRYEKFRAAGFSPAEAGQLSDRIGALEPESGKAQVSDLQRYRAVVGSALPEGKQMAALVSMMEEEPAEKLKAAYRAGVSPEEYISFWEATSSIEADRDKNGKPVSGSKKKKVLDAIDDMDLTVEQKDALYEAAGYSKSTLYSSAPWYDIRPNPAREVAKSARKSGTKKSDPLARWSLEKWSMDRYKLDPW